MKLNTLRYDHIKLAATHSEFINEVINHAHDRRDPILEDLARSYRDAMQKDMEGRECV
ncbi:MAG: hypothetical protein JKY93_01030 [Gammaproteobacteria bacterium]|nr:hypothetical protein [Gammaproteobacteria bacterium]